MNTTNLSTLIEATANLVLDQWTAEATAAGLDIDSYIGDQLDAMEDTEPEVCSTVGRVHLMRVMA